MKVWVQFGLLRSVLFMSARFISPFGSWGFQKQTSLVYPFMQVFVMLPSAVALEYLPQSWKANPQNGSWHHNSSAYFHRTSCGSIFWVFILSVYFSSSLMLFSHHSLSLSSSVCFHPSSIANFSCSCEKAKSNDCVLHYNIYMFLNKQKGELFWGMTKHWNPLLQDAVEANSTHAFKKGLTKLIENRPRSDCKHSGTGVTSSSGNFSALWGLHIMTQIALLFICFLYCLP